MMSSTAPAYTPLADFLKIKHDSLELALDVLRVAGIPIEQFSNDDEIIAKAIEITRTDVWVETQNEGC